MSEAGVPNFISDTWNAISAPPKTPARDRRQAQRRDQPGLEDPEVKEQYARMHLQAVGGTPENMAKIVKEDTARWSAVIKSANVTIAIEPGLHGGRPRSDGSSHSRHGIEAAAASGTISSRSARSTC